LSRLLDGPYFAIDATPRAQRRSRPRRAERQARGIPWAVWCAGCSLPSRQRHASTYMKTAAHSSLGLSDPSFRPSSLLRRRSFPSCWSCSIPSAPLYAILRHPHGQLLAIEHTLTYTHTHTYTHTKQKAHLQLSQPTLPVGKPCPFLLPSVSFASVPARRRSLHCAGQA